ncbi:hypothetical protein [Runella aurantiaca]|uniref:Uncharacterized protein n=1 Tax=Runella aurantiaca TaxID=2282308 RepID=A0A369I521_9BACT|nr:hypothetical protein [Runella aurantiaca]RDB02294.1 hypothetical protein DVG78_29515 [Runella aurantiaca]
MRDYTPLELACGLNPSPEKIEKYHQYLAQAAMILAASKIEGSELNRIIQAENSLYDRHIEKGIPMGQLKTPELEQHFQNQRTTAIENIVRPSDNQTKTYQPENSLVAKTRQKEKLVGYRQEAQAIIDPNRSKAKGWALER